MIIAVSISYLTWSFTSLWMYIYPPIYRYIQSFSRLFFSSLSSLILHLSCIMPIRMKEGQQKQSTHYAHRSRFPSSSFFFLISLSRIIMCGMRVYTPIDGHNHSSIFCQFSFDLLLFFSFFLSLSFLSWWLLNDKYVYRFYEWEFLSDVRDNRTFLIYIESWVQLEN